jgi:hypothetical protein
VKMVIETVGLLFPHGERGADRGRDDDCRGEDRNHNPRAEVETFSLLEIARETEAQESHDDEDDADFQRADELPMRRVGGWGRHFTDGISGLARCRQLGEDEACDQTRRHLKAKAQHAACPEDADGTDGGF